MKHLFYLITLLTFTACQTKSQQEKNLNLAEPGETVVNTIEVNNSINPNSQCELTVEGMTCEIGCVRTVRSHLSKMKGVTYNEISFNSERVEDYITVQFDSSLVNIEAIKGEIESIAQGIYSVTKKETVNFEAALTED